MLARCIFAPTAIAVVGAARESGKLGYSVLENVICGGYRGKVYPVNPNANQILGLRCYRSVIEIPDVVDLAIFVLPSPLMLQAIDDCGRKGVKGIVVITAGFRETGEEGRKAEEEMVNLARRYGIRVLGPNCLGFVDTALGLNATFAPGMLPPGNIALISQSGAMRVAFWDWARRSGMGLSKFFSLGNMADVNETDILELLRDDVQTKVILAYLEGICDGERFRRLTADIAKVKPIVVLKAGNSEHGARAALSHTGAMAGFGAAYCTAFKQAGVLQASSLEELFDWGGALAYQPVPRGDRIAIVTNAGGLGALASDACERAGLSLARFTEEIATLLRSKCSPNAGLSNPVDLVGDASCGIYDLALEALMSDPGTDGIVVFLSPQAPLDIEGLGEVVTKYAAKFSKPILVSFLGGPLVQKTVQQLGRSGVPNYPTPERAVNGFACLNEYRKLIEKTKGAVPERFEVDRRTAGAIIVEAKNRGDYVLGSQQTGRILRAYGFCLPRSLMARSAHEAVDCARQIGFPVVIKVASPNIIHKTDVGGVRLGLADEQAVKVAYDEVIDNAGRCMPEAEISGVEVQSYVKRGREVILGIKHDSIFGPLIMFGLGGIYTEIFRDVTYRLAPVTREDAEDMIRGIRGFPLLSGVRGERPSDIPSIMECLMRLAQLAADFSDIAELDVNPLMTGQLGEGALVVDCRLAMRR